MRGMSTPPATDRTKAARLRLKVKAGQTLMPEDAGWLHSYEAAREEVSRGASRSKVTEFREEEREAVGVGTAAAEAAAAASMVREEGRRLDTLMSTAVGALVRACEMHEKLSASILARAVEDAKVQRELLTAVREHYLARIDAEGEAERAAQGDDKDPITKMAEDMLPALLPMIMAKMGGGGAAPK